MKAFLLRPFPGVNRIDEFINESVVGLGWAELQNLSGKNKDELRQVIVDTVGEPLVSNKLGSLLSLYNIFVNTMSIGDLIVCPNGQDIHFGKIEGDYFYNKDYVDLDYAHQRSVKWLSLYKRDELPEGLRKSLRVQRTTADLTKHLEVIEAFAYSNADDLKAELDIKNIDLVKTVYQLRPDLQIEISVPSDITETEAQRLGDYIKTLYWN